MKSLESNMCDVCNFQKLNTKELNGDKSIRYVAKFYQVREYGVIALNMCYYHYVDFFLKGEKRFIRRYPKILRKLGTSKEELELDFL